MAKDHLATLYITFLLIGCVQCDLLPDSACSSLGLAFKALGCAGGTSIVPYCKYMALAFRLETETGEGLCTSKPCVGYEQTGRRCTNIFPRACSSSKRFSDGLCPIGKECCLD